MNHDFFDDDVPPDASRTFRPASRAPDYSALKLLVAIVLIALGCALLISAASPPLIAIGS